MAKKTHNTGGNLPQRLAGLLERGDSLFVEELRQFHDADQLGAFALPWFEDKRPPVRWLLLQYLRRPLNAYRHEALVKRLFKLAEESGDDEILGRFLVLFDRSVRRQRVRQRRYNWRSRRVEERERLKVPSDSIMPRPPLKFDKKNMQ